MTRQTRRQMFHVKHLAGDALRNGPEKGRMFHVKHDHPSPPLLDDVAAALAAAELDVDPGNIKLLARHAEAVYETNARFNLTRITSAEDFIRLHIVDSLLPWQLTSYAAPALDIGSGAGFPGVTTAIVHGGPMTLCESVGKKADFLRACVEDLALECRVFAGRAEDLARAEPGAYSLVTARAVSQLSALVELAAPLLVDGGRLVAFKGAPSREELASGDAAARLCGLQRIEVHKYALPKTRERRTLVVYSRVRAPSVALPRRPGLAQHAPLG